MSLIDPRPTPMVGQVWQDMDPRGGSTFKITGVSDQYVAVASLNGKRPRLILRKRLRYGKRGYRLVKEA